MHSKIKNLIAVLLVFLFFGNFVACTKGDKGENIIKIGSTYNTYKVMREPEFEFEDLGEKIDVFMAKGETEGGQIIVTPERDVKEIFLHTSDLTLMEDPSVKFPADQIKVFFQKYIEITSKTAKNENEKYSLGFVPDMLLPQEIAVEYGENSIEAGNHQGLTIEFTTDEKTAAGTYTGSFDLEADGVRYALPVTLKVYDILLGDANGYLCIVGNAQSSMTGDYDTTDDSYRRYFETALTEYRFPLSLLPLYNDPTKMAEEIIRYWDYPAFSSYSIPLSTTLKTVEGSNKTVTDRGELYSYMYAIAKRSSEERILFDKAYIYLTFTDEATSSRYDEVRMAREDIVVVQEKVLTDLNAEGFFNEWSTEGRENFEKSLKSIPLVQTTDSSGAVALGDAVQTYCVRLDSIDSPAKREIFKQLEEENSQTNGTTWFYTCMEPAYPYPTHHLDDMLLGTRVMRWMQKDYDWDGYLFWQIFSYTMWTGSSTLLIDPYEDAIRFPNINGDGFWTYPGKKYGLDTFLPSLRIKAFRDGQEDYDFLCQFEDLLQEKAAFYGIEEVSSHQYLDGLYDRLYEDANLCYESDAEFYAMRRQLFELTEQHSSDTKFLSDTQINGTTASTNIYLSEGYGVEVNGQDVAQAQKCGQGYKYTIISDITEDVSLMIAVKKNGAVVENYSLNISGKTVAIALAEGVFEFSEGSSAKYSDGVAEVALCAFGETQSELRKNNRYLWLTKGLKEFDLSELSYIQFNIKNIGTDTVTINFCFGSGDRAGYNLLSYTLEPGETRNLKFDDLYTYETHYSRLSSSEFGFTMQNAHTESVIENGKIENIYIKDPDALFVISDFYYSYKQEGV